HGRVPRLFVFINWNVSHPHLVLHGLVAVTRGVHGVGPILDLFRFGLGRDLGSVLLVHGHQGHAADWAVAGLVPVDLVVHGTGVDGFFYVAGRRLDPQWADRYSPPH